MSAYSADSIFTALGLKPHPEGGFFLGTFRCGSVPMSSRGQTDLACSAKDGNSTTDLVIQADGKQRKQRRPDGDGRRNCPASIFWLPPTASPALRPAVNLSGHVNYWQGGGAFGYKLVGFCESAAGESGPLTYTQARLTSRAWA